jgi:hypothetical protein
MRLVGAFVLGALAALGIAAALVLARHPLARYAWHEAVQQDVEAIRGAAFWRR